MKDKLIKLESIIQEYVNKDSISWEKYRYLHENMETVLLAIQQFSRVEEMQKTLEWYADKNNYVDAMEPFTYENGFSGTYYRTVDAPIKDDQGSYARQALKGDHK